MLVFDSELVRNQIKKYQLEKQYKKSIEYIESNFFNMVRLKLRKPKHRQIFQFRINKKFRALAVKKENCLYVFKISDHQ